jgi:hypothetical protein
MTESYFTTTDGVWFRPTELARGPWDASACHAGPPTGLVVRALERLVPHQRLARVGVDLIRPIPLAGFRVQAEVRRPGRSVTLSEAEVLDDEQVYARVSAMHLRQIDPIEVTTAIFDLPRFEDSVPGRFPIHDTRHGQRGFADSLEVRYDPSGSKGDGGPTVIWMRTPPLLADEEPSGFQRLCPLADSGNGISHNEYLDRVLFVNPDLTISIHRLPVGDWIGARMVSHWRPDGTGMADSELFDVSGPVGRAVQNLLLTPLS